MEEKVYFIAKSYTNMGKEIATGPRRKDTPSTIYDAIEWGRSEMNSNQNCTRVVFFQSIGELKRPQPEVELHFFSSFVPENHPKQGEDT
jgi:hypothetical protein